MKIVLKLFQMLAILLFCYPCLALTEYQRGKELITQAPLASKNFTYIAMVNRPDFHDNSITSGRFYRWIDEDGFVYKKVELYKNYEWAETYLQNKTGQYGTIGNVSARMVEALILSKLELLFEDFNEVETLFSKYTIEESRYRDIPCYQVTVRDPDDPILVAGMSRMTIDQVENKNSPFNHQRPSTRVLWIGKEDNIIYARKHYNRFGKLLLAIEIGKLEKNAELSSELFTTPEDLYSEVPLLREELKDLVHRINKKAQANAVKPSWTGWRTAWLGPLAVMDTAAWVLCGLGIALAVVAISLKLKAKLRR